MVDSFLELFSLSFFGSSLAFEGITVFFFSFSVVALFFIILRRWLTRV